SKEKLTLDLTADSESKHQNDLYILRKLSQLIWPHDSPEVKQRVLLSLSLLLGAKALNVQVPYIFKLAVDDLTVGTVMSSDAILWGTPALLLTGWGIARFGAVACGELQRTVFSKVAQRAIRSVTRQVFVHLHNLDHSFHLSRQTGALNRTIDRGTRGINFILSAAIFNVVPTALEISLVAGILTYNFGPSFGVLTGVTLASYTAFTFATTQVFLSSTHSTTGVKQPACARHGELWEGVI
ncbi:hypothetical protein CYMTET_6339, partial [Cymbomonas tetramitiformis]